MADQKITQLTALATIPDDADILAIVDDVAGTPITKKITVANLLSRLFKSYSPTLADVANTITETTALSFTVPANDMADGDIIIIQFAALVKNNKGTAGSFQVDIYWGTDTINLVTAINWNSRTTEILIPYKIVMQRVGADLILVKPNAVLGATYTLPINNLAKATPNDTDLSDVTISAPTFNVEKVVALKITLGAADATFYFKPQVARIYKSVA